MRVRRPVSLLLAGLVALAAPAGLLPSAAAPAAAASACGPGKTSLGGALVGYPNAAALRASVNIELTSADTKRAYDVYTDGRVDTVGHPAGTRYSYVDVVNPAATTAQAALAPVDRTWGKRGGSGALCFTTNPRITQAYIEIYPRRAVDDNGDGSIDRYLTDRSAYGASAHYRQPVRAGSDNLGIQLRLPQNIPSAVGYVHGYITYRNRPVPPAAPGCGAPGKPLCIGITTVRAFPADTYGPNCGVEGFSAQGDRLDPRARSGTATYYRINALAGGRCRTLTQAYRVRVTCVTFCGRNSAGGLSRVGVPAQVSAVKSGAGTRADISFG